MKEKVTFDTCNWSQLSKFEKLKIVQQRNAERREEAFRVKKTQANKKRTKKEKPVPFTGKALEMFAKLPPELQKGLV